MNVARCDERVDPRPLGVLHSLPSRLDVLLVASGKAADDGNIAGIVDGVADGLGDGFDGLEVFLGSGGKPSFDYVDPELSELTSDVELFLGGESSAGRLFAVSEGGVEDADVVGVGDAVGDVFRAAAEGMRRERRWVGGGGGAGETDGGGGVEAMAAAEMEGKR